jgi:hypothetical protein
MAATVAERAMGSAATKNDHRIRRAPAVETMATPKRCTTRSDHNTMGQSLWSQEKIDNNEPFQKGVLE